MEPSWTEPPPFTWVFNGGHEGWVCRRQSGTAVRSGQLRHGSVMPGREEKHIAQGHAMRWSAEDRW